MLTKYVHSAAEQRAAAASLLLRLLKLTPREITPSLLPLLTAAAHDEASIMVLHEHADLGDVGGQGLGGLDPRGGGDVYTGADPRAEWPMAPLHALLPYVEWHAQHGGTAGHVT